MELLQEVNASRNILTWVILIVSLIVFIKVLKSASKWLVMLAVFIGLVFLLHKMFPGLLDPAIDFVRGSWLGKHLPDKPW